MTQQKFRSRQKSRSWFLSYSCLVASCLLLDVGREAHGMMEGMKNLFSRRTSLTKSEIPESQLGKVQKPQFEFTVIIFPELSGSTQDDSLKSPIQEEKVKNITDCFAKTPKEALAFKDMLEDDSIETTLVLDCDRECTGEAWKDFFEGLARVSRLRFGKYSGGLSKSLWKILGDTFNVNTLESIESAYTPLSDGVDSLKKIVNRNPDLKTLNFFVTLLKPEETTLFFKDLVPCRSLTTLSLVGTGFDDEGLAHLSTFLKNSLDLNSLVISGDFRSTFTLEGVQRLIENLKNHSHIREFTLANVPEDCGQAVITMIEDHALEKLTFYTRGDQGSVKMVEGLGKAISKNTSIKELKLGCLQTTEQAVVFFDAIKGNNTLTSLDLRECNLSGEGAISFSKMLYENTSLKQLNLLQTKLDEIGARTIVGTRIGELPLEWWLDQRSMVVIHEALPILLRKGNVFHTK